MNWEDPKDVLRALVLLYSLQTQDEKISHSTQHLNDVGFRASDAAFCTDIAQNILHKGYGVSQKQYDAIRKILPIYHRQIELYGIDHITLPETAVIRFKREASSLTGDGLLRIRDDRLEFVPNIYPSKQIQPHGFAWGRDGIKTWTSILSIDKVYAVQTLFPNVVLDETVQQYLENKAKPADLSEVTKTSKLFEPQKDAVSFLIKPYDTRGRRRGLLALAPGCGKTATAIFAAEELKGRTLVICPLSLTRNWKKEVRKWVGKESTIWHGFIDDPTDYEWVITNYDTIVNNGITYDVRWEEENGKKIKVKYNWRTVYPFGDFFDNLILDESILVKNRKAQRVSAMEAMTKEIKNVWLLSGSPASRFFDDMWSQFHLLDPSRFSSYWRFANDFCIVENNQWGMAIVGNRDNAHNHIKGLYQDIYFSRTQEEMFNIPDWIFEDIDIEMSKYQERMYGQMETEFLAELPEGDEVLAPNILSQMIRLVQIASNPSLIGGNDDGAKWRALPEVMEYTEGPHLIWAVHKQTIKSITDYLTAKKFRIKSMTGETPEELRQGIVDTFQAGDLDAIIAHPGVGRFGHTLTKARTAIYLERSYDGDHYYQSLYRFRRIGTTQSPYVVHLIAARGSSEDPTIDRVIGRVLKYRKDNAQKITSGLIKRAFKGEL